ncbi:MAG: nickel pincer cofactor biosynthesis protein LarB [Asgard group archaeon]|nr:nickel pincer cofactor biosynthesis protein LarB [Asgard group archaeon]
MDIKQLEKLLQAYKKDELGINEILEKLRDLPFEDLGFAKVDHHRALRKGYPEVIYCPGKTTNQIIKIYKTLIEKNETILLTRVQPAVYEEIKSIDKDIQYHREAKLAYRVKKQPRKKGSVLVICGGTADIPVAEEAAITAELMGAKVGRIYDAGVAGIHRLLYFKDQLFQANIIVVIAGMEGALPSVVAGLVPVTVIAVPTSVGYGTNLGGIAPLLTMLNSCAPNVAVVNIDNGFGGGLIAANINRQIVEK